MGELKPQDWEGFKKGTHYERRELWENYSKGWKEEKEPVKEPEEAGVGV